MVIAGFERACESHPDKTGLIYPWGKSSHIGRVSKRIRGYENGHAMRMKKPAILILNFFFLWVGCQTTYYAMWETLGKEKRHLLKDEVEKAKSEQEKAAEQFKDVLTRMKEMYGFQGGELEEFYTELKADYEKCEGRAEAVRKKVDKVEEIAGDLFEEWEKEIEEISSPNLRAKSSASLKQTKEKYAKLSKAMKKAESSMDPVLRRLKDYVLFLKHNLNAQAMGALKKEVRDIEVEVKRLIGDMDQSIKEAEIFMNTLEKAGGGSS